MVTVYFTSAIRQRTGESETNVDYRGDVAGLLDLLGQRYGARLLEALRPSNGIASPNAVAGYVNIYVNGTDIRHLQSLATPLEESATVDLVPSVSGG